MTVNIYAAKTMLSRLIDAAAEGKEIIIARGGRPVAKLVPLNRRKRRLGALAGEFRVPAGFDAPLPARAVRLFEGD